MATIGEIVQEQSYRGDANLAGYGAPILIDTAPLDQLARFTMIKNKFMYEEEEKKNQEIAGQMADLSNYDLIAIPEESNQLQAEYDKLYNFARENTSVLDYTNNKQGYLDFIKKKSDLRQKMRTAKARNFIYEKWQSDINSAATPELKTLLKKELADNIKNTNIDQPLPAQQKFDITLTTTDAPPIKKFDITVLGGKNGNENIVREVKASDYSAIDAQINSIVLGLKGLEANKDGTAEQKAAYDAQVASGKLMPILKAQALNEGIVGLPRDEKGNVDYTNAPSLIKGSVKAIDDANAIMAKDKEELMALKDNFGRPIFGGQSGINTDNYTPIDRNNITAEGLLKAEIISKRVPTSYETKVQPTDNAYQYAALAQDEAQAKRQYGLQLEQIRASKAAKGKTTQELLAEMGNALDSFTNYGSAKESKNQFHVDNATGMWIDNKTGMPYTSDPKAGTRIKGSNVPEKIRNLIKGANPDYVFSDAATLVIINGQVQSIQYDGENPIDRNTIQMNQVKQVSDYTEKGNPFLPYYGPGSGNASRPAPKTTETQSGRTSNTVKVQGANGKIHNVPESDVQGVLKKNKGAKIIK